MIVLNVGVFIICVCACFIAGFLLGRSKKK